MTEKNKTTTLNHRFAPILTFTLILLFLLIAGILMTALLSYHVSDPAWSHNQGSNINNTLGVVGAWYSDISFSLLGKPAFLVPMAFVAFAFHAWLEKGIDKELLSWRLFMLLTAILSGCVLWTKHDPQIINSVAQTGGGALGAWLTIGLEKSIKSVPVIMAFSLLVFMVSISLLFNFPWLRVMEWIGQAVSRFFSVLFAGFAATKAKSKSKAVMTASSDAPPPADENLQNKLDAINQLAETAPTSEEPRSQFTIDRYEADDDELEWFDDPKTPSTYSDTPTHSIHADDKTVDLSHFGLSQSDVKKTTTRVEEKSQVASMQAQAYPQLDTDDSIALNVSAAKTQDTQDITAVTFATKEEKQQPIKAEPAFFDLDETMVESLPLAEAVSSDNKTTTTEQAVVEKSPTLSGFNMQATSKTNPYSLSSVMPQFTATQQAASPTFSSEDSKTDDTIDAVTHEKAHKTVQETSSKDSQATLEPDYPTLQASLADIKQSSTAAKTEQALPKTQATIDKAYDAQAQSADIEEQSYELPSIELLDNPPPQTTAYTEDMLADMALVLETTLKQFNVTATVMRVTPGPVITRFEIDLAPGIQAKKITNLSQDLARALAVSRVRVEEVIAGNSYVGLEVPNKAREVVYFKDVVRSKVFQNSKSPLTVSLGSDTSGKPVVADLMKMPHALVAGTTGSGKSVCINVMLLSMLYKATPKDLRLILVDPKMLEMSMYEDIPHLLTPVITDMNEAENALTWAVGEMERRYQLMAAMKVRKIDSYNDEVEKAIAKGEPIKDPLWQPNESVGYTHHPTLERLPFIVIVIDELADMMMVVGKQVEQLIARLTQKARAAGIHVVLATQRPSTDVLTGLIKANVPTRIAFQVSSGTDSRVIIDSVGAEKLLGHGDMLYVPPGAPQPQRLHGAFVGDAETERITGHLRSLGEPDYIAGITIKQAPETLGAFGAAEAAASKQDADPLYEEAVQIVLETGKASISSVQRQLRIGYNRAARMIEDMQEQGIVSEPVAGVRKVLGMPKT